jgi:CHAT domain-containing protein
LWDGHRFLSEIHEVGYSPNATLYCAPSTPELADSSVFVAFSPRGDITAAEEVEEASTSFPGATVLINPSISALSRAFERPQALIHIAGHVSVDPVGGKLSWIETDEGRLTGRDLTGMSIRTRTLVITGCKTARRTISSGDEWQGMMRDFYMSGATSIVSAFWNIRDRSARSFTRSFYRSFNGKNTTTAVRETALTLFKEEAHPYFWAGFAAFVRKAV